MVPVYAGSMARKTSKGFKPMHGYMGVPSKGSNLHILGLGSCYALAIGRFIGLRKLYNRQEYSGNNRKDKREYP